MDYSKFYVNYTTLKRRGFDGNYQYIFTVHKYPVRMSGYDDIEFLSSLNNSVGLRSDDEYRFASSIARSRSKVLQLGCNNKWDYFVTLTISPDSSVDRYDFKAVVKSLLKFFDNYKQRKSTDFKYLVIPEKHKDGAYHFHGFFANIAPADLKTNQYGYLDFVPYCKKYGFCSMSAIKDMDACANYIAKYITKDMFAGTIPEPRTHLYYASRGLKFDELLKVGTAAPVNFSSIDGCIAVNSAYVTRYYCRDNIFKSCLNELVDPCVSPDMPTPDNIEHLKKRVVYDFCDDIGYPISPATNILSLYNALKAEILDRSFTDYDALKQYYHNMRHFFKSAELSEAEAAALDDLFKLSLVAETVSDTTAPDEPISIWSLKNAFK